ncbi:MAG: hypothetical protein LBH37_01320 [Oscillospiraceae bacterium]|nr:hypothetical protein [Oscillospiraceae bacterium]
MVAAKILIGRDNNSFMYNPVYPHCCDSCHYATKQEVNPDFRLARQRYDVSCINLHPARKQYDVSYTWDGYLIVSKRFKQFCEEKSYQNAVFHSIPQEPDFYFLESSKIIPLDYARRPVEFIDLCKVCNRYAEVIGMSKNFVQQGFFMEENTFYRTEYDFGSHNRKSPLIIVSLQMAKEMAAQKFKGLYFDDVLK